MFVTATDSSICSLLQHNPVAGLPFISVMSDQVSLPIIIDDGFVNFDYLRKERVLAILTRLARHNQVLYFTADHRARQLTGVIDLERLDSE